uniref:Uncharacterized protein n=1 Tax=Rhizophora mucronata TaxID=61149 RepID=A0A2P2IQQ0_RHIMU
MTLFLWGIASQWVAENTETRRRNGKKKGAWMIKTPFPLLPQFWLVNVQVFFPCVISVDLFY